MPTSKTVNNMEADAKWKLWYQDLFDRECPRQVQKSGVGLFNGVMELWKRHLFETINAKGQKGFSRFNIWWEQENKSIEVVGDIKGAFILRQWLSDNTSRTPEGNKILLERIVIAHLGLLKRGESSEKILAAANSFDNFTDFNKHLLSLEESIN